MNKEYVISLFQNYLRDTATTEELQQLELALRDPVNEEMLKELIDKSYFQLSQVQLSAIPDALAKENSFNFIIAQPQNKKPVKLWRRMSIAASILLFLSVGSYFLFTKQPAQQNVQNQPNDISAERNKAILTLSNGQQILLNDAKNGTLAKQGNTVINKTNDGAIAYNGQRAESSVAGADIEYNTITVPRGSTYKLTLTDGTKVWLNAISSLKYPTSFKGRERNVEIVGEAYFEVAHNKQKPFHVKAAGQTVEVLGTHFNINAYPDEEKIKTDLLEGSVKVSKNKESALLKPGQASVILANQSKILVRNADVQSAVAWKNGLFSFKRADLKTVMRQISRWYDVDVSYQGEIPETAITGTIDRNLSAAKALEIISNLGVSYKSEGKKVIITK